MKLHRHEGQAVVDNTFIGVVIGIPKPFPKPMRNLFNGKTVILRGQIAFARSALCHGLVLAAVTEFQLVSGAALGER